MWAFCHHSLLFREKRIHKELCIYCILHYDYSKSKLIQFKCIFHHGWIWFQSHTPDCLHYWSIGTTWECRKLSFHCLTSSNSLQIDLAFQLNCKLQLPKKMHWGSQPKIWTFQFVVLLWSLRIVLLLKFSTRQHWFYLLSSLCNYYLESCSTKLYLRTHHQCLGKLQSEILHVSEFLVGNL